MSVMQELQDVFRKAFADDTIVLNEAMTAEDIEDWDSLSHVGLVLAAEKHFGIRFNTTEISMLENVGQFAQLIRDRTGRE
ncbi:MAG: acyl carrier protein [Bosea sp.]|uniref:acyl carrier protein n=1 Tax=Bosea sp. (in: a-proteobacteria) TaxID=1871050 RepID=UPI0023A7605F|nr:acyl carrier protein [Bosea sp. (in: a-proteobacteria)]MCP4733281.1 acyl carrier protein [Bosea sp. (in: a-proteobacteria)]